MEPQRPRRFVSLGRGQATRRHSARMTFLVLTFFVPVFVFACWFGGYSCSAQPGKIIAAKGLASVTPVAPDVSQAAPAKVDILAHPGMILPEEAELAAKNGVYRAATGGHRAEV